MAVEICNFGLPGFLEKFVVILKGGVCDDSSNDSLNI